MQQETKAKIMEVIFIGSLLAANVLAVKLFALGKFVQSAGIIAYPITFMVTDALGDVFGKERAKKIVYLGLLAQVFFMLLVLAGRFLPYPPFWQGQGAYEQILGMVPRIVGASLAAYVVAQLHDVWAFHFWKDKTKGKHLWLRNNASTMVSQAFDSVIFIFIAFAGIVPWPVLFSMMAVQYVTKLVIAAADTPVVYLAVWWLKRK